MRDAVRLGCQKEIIEIPLAKILPMRLLDEGIVKDVQVRVHRGIHSRMAPKAHKHRSMAILARREPQKSVTRNRDPCT